MVEKIKQLNLNFSEKRRFNNTIKFITKTELINHRNTKYHKIIQSTTTAQHTDQTKKRQYKCHYCKQNLNTKPRHTEHLTNHIKNAITHLNFRQTFK